MSRHLVALLFATLPLAGCSDKASTDDDDDGAGDDGGGWDLGSDDDGGSGDGGSGDGGSGDGGSDGGSGDGGSGDGGSDGGSSGDGGSDGGSGDGGSDGGSGDGGSDGGSGDGGSGDGGSPYTGGWPYQPDKDDIEGLATTVTDELTVGEQVPRVTMLDQFGDEVDLFDFAGHGRPVVLSLSAAWCGPCLSLESWIRGLEAAPGWSRSWPLVPGFVEDDEVYWVTILVQDTSGEPPVLADLEDFAETYPHDDIPVLADDGMWDAYLLAYPTVVLLDENMIILSAPETTSDFYVALDAMEALLGR